MSPQGKRAGETLVLSDLRGKLVGLIFGSYTWPPFRAEAVRLNDLAKGVGEQIQFICVYVEEAHPTYGSQSPKNEAEGILFARPTNADERAEVAADCMLRINFSFPMVLDNMNNETVSTYVAMPERLYLLDENGRVTWKCGLGLHYFYADGFERAARDMLALT